MQLIAWRHTGKNPSGEGFLKPPTHITIAPREKMTFVFPWVLPLERAIEVFGAGVVDQIGEEPVAVELSLALV